MKEIMASRKMREDEFMEYQETIAVQYEKELVQSGITNAEEARNLALSEIAKLLPDGVHTKGHHLDIMVNAADEEVGFLWYGKRRILEMDVSFIYDIIVYDSFRRAGYGTKMINFMGDLMKKEGVNKIVLNVFSNNKAANALYESMNFEILAEESGQKVMIKNL
ncbi:GNAT family N-acetyltransferase [Paenibacillus sp. BAC0078]